MLKPFLVLVFYIKAYLVKMCLIFDGSSLAFGASYQSFLRVYWFLPLGVTNFAYPSEKFNDPYPIILGNLAVPYRMLQNFTEF